MQEKKDVDILDYYLMTQSHWYDDIIMMYHQSAAETFSFLAEGRLLELDVKTCQQNTIYLLLYNRRVINMDEFKLFCTVQLSLLLNLNEYLNEKIKLIITIFFNKLKYLTSLN